MWNWRPEAFLSPSPRGQQPVCVSKYCVIDGWNATDLKPSLFFPTSHLPVVIDDINLSVTQSRNLDIFQKYTLLMYPTIQLTVTCFCYLHPKYCWNLACVLHLWVFYPPAPCLSDPCSTFLCPLDFGGCYSSLHHQGPPCLLSSWGVRLPSGRYQQESEDRTENSSFSFWFFSWHTPCLSARLPSPFLVPITMPTFL